MAAIGFPFAYENAIFSRDWVPDGVLSLEFQAARDRLRREICT